MNPLPSSAGRWASRGGCAPRPIGSSGWIPIVFLAVWQGIAYSVLIYLAGLQTIDEIYEAAAIDGVNAW